MRAEQVTAMDDLELAPVPLSPPCGVHAAPGAPRSPTSHPTLKVAHASDLLFETEPRPPPEHDAGEATTIPSPPRGHEVMRTCTRSTPVHSPCQVVAKMALRRGAAVLWIIVVMSPAGLVY